MITFKNIDHVYIPIPPGEAQRGHDFYCGILGFREIEKPLPLQGSQGFWVQYGSIELHIGMEKPGPKSKRHIAFEVENLKSIRDHLQEKSIPIEEGVLVQGRDRLYFCDFWDNKIELIEYC